jgi:putative exosortase-associated protein (TIGR04073 family)
MRTEKRRVSTLRFFFVHNSHFASAACQRAAIVLQGIWSLLASGGTDMRTRFIVLPFFLIFLVTIVPVHAADGPESDVIVEHMAVKLVRGVTNIATSVVELPKQTYLTIKEDGASGFVIGPLKGIGMTLARTTAGALELFTFFLAYPGFYDPYIDPQYVWEMGE